MKNPPDFILYWGRLNPDIELLPRFRDLETNTPELSSFINFIQK